MPDCVSNAKNRKRRRKLAEDKIRSLSIPAVILLVVAVLDQITKLWAVHSLADGAIHQVLGSLFQVKLVYNEGGVMGTNFGSDTFYLISSLFVLAFVFYFVYTARANKHLAYPMAAVAGGAVGNLIDRIRLSKVIDFVDIDFFNVSFGSFQFDRWWTFNIADAAITIGVIYVLIIVVFTRHAAVNSNPSVPEKSSGASLDI